VVQENTFAFGKSKLIISTLLDYVDLFMLLYHLGTILNDRHFERK